jgi:ubiquinone/menaquinone biosynthesis C-methylase UbiE
MTIENRFDLAAATWDENLRRRDLVEAIAGAIEESIPLSREMTMLDYGCGTALLSVHLAEKVRRITAVDTSSGMIAETRRKITAVPELAAIIEPMLLTDGDIQQLQGPWDLICTAMAMHHIDDAHGTLRHLARCLNPGGYLAVADLCAEDGSFHGEERVPHNGFDPQVLAASLEEAGLNEIHIRNVFRFPKPTAAGELREYEVFLLTARRAL